MHTETDEEQNKEKACGNEDTCCGTGNCEHSQEDTAKAEEAFDPERAKFVAELGETMKSLNAHCLQVLVDKLHFPKTVPCPECELARMQAGESGNQADADVINEALSCSECGGTGRVSPGYPIVVTVIKPSGRIFTSRPGIKPGDKVSIRPCSGNPSNKTYLGYYVTEAPRGIGIGYDQVSGQLSVEPMDRTPSFIVPELGRIVLGSDSWWERLKENETIKQISDEDIQEVWYVKAMRENWSKDQIAEYIKNNPGEEQDLIDYLQSSGKQQEDQDSETENKPADTINGSEAAS